MSKICYLIYNTWIMLSSECLSSRPFTPQLAERDAQMPAGAPEPKRTGLHSCLQLTFWFKRMAAAGSPRSNNVSAEALSGLPSQVESLNSLH